MKNIISTLLLVLGGRSYRIHLSGLFIFLATLSSASVALFLGRVASYYYVITPQDRQIRLQLPSLRNDACPESVVMEEAAVNNMAMNDYDYEALVHPAMITHPNPKRVIILGSHERVETTSATLREVLKHTFVQKQDAVVVDENAEDTHYQVQVAECSKSGRQFDVIIDPAPVKVVTDVVGRAHISSLFDCLGDEGILVLNLDKIITNKDPALGLGSLTVFGEILDELEKVGYKSMHLYSDESNGFTTRRSFLVALKSYASRADWYSNEAEVNIRLHQRINKDITSLKFFDAPTMLKYQTPSKAVETAYCRGGDIAREEECKELGALDPQLSNVPVSALSVGQSTMGEYSGRGLFAIKDIPEGTLIGLEKNFLSYFILPSTHQIIEEMYYWVEENYNEEAYASEVFESISVLEAFSTGYGVWSTFLGRTHSTVDSGILMFCNHGCNGTYNYGVVTGFTEANVDLKQPPELPTLFRKASAFSPVVERNIRQYLSSGYATNRVIKQGEELLCNYLEYIGSPQDWEEEIRSLRGQCDGSEVGDITDYESNK